MNREKESITVEHMSKIVENIGRESAQINSVLTGTSWRSKCLPSV